MNLKKLVSIACASVFMLACSLEASHCNSNHHNSKLKSSNAVAYARASSESNQFPENLDPQIALIDHLNSSNLIQLKNNHLIVEEAGKYFVTASVQAGTLSIAPVGYVDLWLIKNGVPLPETRTRVTILNMQTVMQLTSQAVIELNKRDSLEIGFSSSNTKIGLIANTNPIIPNLTVSLFRIK